MTARYLCLRCGEVAIVDPEVCFECCPSCGATTIPADLDNDTVNIDITWHELRILTMWAERYTTMVGTEDDQYDMGRTIANIADRIIMQYPDQRALTFTAEIASLADIGVVHVVGAKLIPPPREAL